MRILACVVIALIVSLVLSPCLGGFYFSEDLIQTYLAKISLTDHPELAWQRLWMPWIQCSNMGLFYRPVIDFSFLSDNFLYAHSALGQTFGSHLTNLLCHLTSSIFCFSITLFLLGGEKKAITTSVVAGLLFGLNPLQDETIYWMVCRCDCLCTMFSLIAVRTGMQAWVEAERKQRLTWQALSTVACLLAILAKEQAVFIPFLLWLYAWIFAPEANKRQRFIKSLRFFGGYALMLACYTALRLAILGGIGGYHGSIGVELNSTFLKRFATPLAWNKIFYPFDEEVFGRLNLTVWPTLFSLAYGAMALGAYFGMSGKNLQGPQRKTIFFLLGAALIVMLPTYQSFVVIETLFGGRCSYLAQAFCAPVLAMLLSAVRPAPLRYCLIPLYLGLLAVTNYLNGTAWIDRGNNMRAFQKGANQWAKTAPASRLLCPLNVPFDCRELSSVYDLEQLRCLLRPPINSIDLSDKVAQPAYLRMAEDALNLRRLRELVAAQVDFVVSSVALGEPFRVIPASELSGHLQKIDTTVPCRELALSDAEQKSPVRPYELVLRPDLMAQRADVVAITLGPAVGSAEALEEPTPDRLSASVRAMPVNYCPTGSTIFLRWYTDMTAAEPWINWSTASFADDNKKHTYLFAIGDRISWKAATRINKLLLMGVPKNYRVLTARLLSEESLVPTLEPSVEKLPGGDRINKELSKEQIEVNEDSVRDGFYPVNSDESVHLLWNAREIAGAKSCQLQISQCDVSFSQLAGGFRESDSGEQSLKLLANLPLAGTKILRRADFNIDGKYETRLAAIDAKGAVLGFYSDPVSLLVSGRPFYSKLDKAMFNLRAQRAR